MLRLRDRGCTVFFSSHILSDAEALCSRVAIVANGRLRAQGTLSDIVAFERRGWELVVANLSETAKADLRGRVTTITPLSNQRYTLEVPSSEPPAALIRDLARHGVDIVSLNPIRTTLEDYFVSTVTAAAPPEVAKISA
jgi:ABC-2 type transport system ATP-binding protein